MTYRIGTSHFISKAAAIDYYWPYFGINTVEEVNRKLKDGEISRGPPNDRLKPGDRIVTGDPVNGKDTRYFIETETL